MSKRYVRRVGTQIHDIDDNPFTLRGVGIGGWLLFEGYMVRCFGDIDRSWRFQEHLVRMVGRESATWFLEQWYRRFFTATDVRWIRQAGFNSIRIALDYQFLFAASEDQVDLHPHDEHFRLLDEIIAACSVEYIYVILDLHAAPGGQTGTNIDNSRHDRPALFERDLYQQQLIHIWRTIAARYRDESYVAAYDLLNEPLPKWQAQHNDKLMPLYQNIITAIRQVDPNHMITLEGLHWATDWSCFTERPDDNILLQFHKYWNNPDVDSLGPYLQTRADLQVPIFMGEGGENNLGWYYAVFKLYDQLDISFNFWTYKKMATHNSLVSFRAPDRWNAFLAGTLDQSTSMTTLEELLANVSKDNVTWNETVRNHILQKNDLFIPAYAFDYRGEQRSHHAIKPHEACFRKSDGMALTHGDHRTTAPNFKHYGGEEPADDDRIVLHLQPKEWVDYSFAFDHDRTLDKVRVLTIDKQPANVIVTILRPSAHHRLWRVRLTATSQPTSLWKLEITSKSI